MHGDEILLTVLDGEVPAHLKATVSQPFSENARFHLENAVQLMRRNGVQLCYATTPEEEPKAQAILDAFYDLQDALEDDLTDEDLVNIARQSRATLREHLPASDPNLREAFKLMDLALGA